MSTRILLTTLVLSLALALTACSPADEPGAEVPGDPGTSPGSELQLAPGLYDLDDGTAQAIGTLEWIDLEGGFWAVTDGTLAEDAGGRNVAVIANWDELQDLLAPLEGRRVSVVGERFDGASIRMAGPEIIAESVEEMGDAGIAE